MNQAGTTPCDASALCRGVPEHCRATEAVCGACVFFEPFETTEMGEVRGRCRLGKVQSFYSCTHVACPERKARPASTRQPEAGARAVEPDSGASPTRSTPAALHPAALCLEASPSLEALPSSVDEEEPDGGDGPGDALSTAIAATVRRELGRDWRVGMRNILARFEGGQVVVKQPGAQDQSFPIEKLFRRLCHIKGALARLEEALDDQPGFTHEERETCARHLRGIEGSLTTFNLLFQDRTEGFQGTGQKH